MLLAASCLTLLFLLLPARSLAQTSQRLSVQGSALFADIYGDSLFAVAGGFGFEAQLRYTPSSLSIGGGIQYTKHKDSQAEIDGYTGDINLIGLFVEPRYTVYVGSDRMAPYVAARFAIARLDLFNDFGDGSELSWESPGVTLNAGGGLLVRLTSRANLDLGMTAGFTHYRKAEAEYIDAGGNVEPFDVVLGSGTNLVFRLGLAFGLGG